MTAISPASLSLDQDRRLSYLPPETKTEDAPESVVESATPVAPMVCDAPFLVAEALGAPLAQAVALPSLPRASVASYAAFQDPLYGYSF